MAGEIEQIKERVGVVELIGEYVKLEKAGSNYRALCPFHNEKTPSFMVNPERNFWYCFGCQEGGDIFTFLQKIEGLEFREALVKLAERANVQLPRLQRRDYQKEKSEKEEVWRALELTTEFYQRQLLKNNKARAVIQYLKERGFTWSVIYDFKIGYAPEGWDNLLNYLQERKIKPAVMLKAGLLVEGKAGKMKGQGKSYYDRFRNRIMFPILDASGRAVGYSGRINPAEEGTAVAKYINTPQTLVYDKSRVLYGLYQAKEAIRRSGYAIVVEGNADVVLSHTVGVKNIVAVSGTALTEEQVALLKRYTDKVMLAFDMDEAGRKATERSLAVCLRNDLEVKVILLAERYKDVGDVIQDKPRRWPEFIKKALPVMEYYFDTLINEESISDIRRKKLVIRKLIGIIANIADPVERSYWLKKLAARTAVEEALLTDLLKKVKLKDVQKDIEGKKAEEGQSFKSFREKEADRYSVLQCRLLGLASEFREELKDELRSFTAENYLSPMFLTLFENVRRESVDKEQENLLNKCVLELKYKKEGDDLLEVEIKPQREWTLVLEEMDKIKKQARIKAIQKKLRLLEERGDEQGAQKLLSKLTEILDT